MDIDDTGPQGSTRGLSLGSDPKRNFILQQGFGEPTRERCPREFSALQFQPRVVTAALAIGIATQSPALFLALGGLLWWGALFPRRNLFDAVYNRTLASRPGAVRLEPAPPPRRFAQTLAGGFSVVIALCLLADQRTAAYVVEGLFAIPVLVLTFGRFCFGSFAYHLLRGRADFVRRTMPWSRGHL